MMTSQESTWDGHDDDDADDDDDDDDYSGEHLGRPRQPGGRARQADGQAASLHHRCGDSHHHHFTEISCDQCS